MRLHLLLYLVIGVPIVLCGHCPQGAVDSITDGQCVVAIDSAGTFSNAKQVCGLLNGSLIKIKNSFMNALAVQQLVDAGAITPAFIGVIKNRTTGEWTYVDGTTLTYVRWKAGVQFNETFECAEMNTEDAYWHPTSCFSSRSAICTFPDTLPDLVCGKDWTYIPEMRSCFFLRAAVNAPPTYNFSTALSVCRGMGADLVSIHSAQQNSLIMNLISTKETGIDCNNYEVIIGLTMISGVQAWTDGSSFDYSVRAVNNQPVYAMINETGCTQYWQNWAFDSKFQRFLCKRAAPSLHERIAELIASLPGNGLNKK